MPHIVDSGIYKNNSGIIGEHVPVQALLKGRHLIAAYTGTDDLQAQFRVPGGEGIPHNGDVPAGLVPRLRGGVAQEDDPVAGIYFDLMTACYTGQQYQSQQFRHSLFEIFHNQFLILT